MSPPKSGPRERTRRPFLHERPRTFRSLISRIAKVREIPEPLVEKDYWVTHTLWSIQQQTQLTVCFKGGTSLAKCFGLIQRFSEDVDLHIAVGDAAHLPSAPHPWKAEYAEDRRTFFVAVMAMIQVPGATVEYLESVHSPSHRNAVYAVRYRPVFPNLDGTARDYVQVEVTPDAISAAVGEPVASMLHDALEFQSQREKWRNNQPTAISCMHPLATLLGKIEAISRQFVVPNREAQAFARHYEDAHHIVRAQNNGHLPPLPAAGTVRGLAVAMRATDQIRREILPDDPAFTRSESYAQRWAELESAHAALAPWYWGPRVPLQECCTVIRDWLTVERPFGDSPQSEAL